MKRILKNCLILTLLIGISSCTTLTVEPDVPCPNRPTLEAFVAEELTSMTDEAKRKAAQNQIKLKGYAKKLEVRAGCDNDSL